MGASLSSDIYQYKVDSHLEGINQWVAKADDIIIFDNDCTDHDKTVGQVMEKAKEVGVRFNPTKCQFRHTEVKFFRLMLTKQGVVPDPAKIKALKKLPEHRSENLLQSFLGIVNYQSRFYPKIVDLTHNLRGLLTKGNEFKWNEVHTRDFKAIIQMLCSNGKLLRYDRPELRLFLEGDTSSVATGMALLQSDNNERESLYPITYGSKMLTEAETRYANKECKLLGVVGAMEKSNYFTFGRPVHCIN